LSGKIAVRAGASARRFDTLHEVELACHAGRGPWELAPLRFRGHASPNAIENLIDRQARLTQYRNQFTRKETVLSIGVIIGGLSRRGCKCNVCPTTGLHGRQSRGSTSPGAKG